MVGAAFGVRDDEQSQLNAGSGYDYLTRHVAGLDATEKDISGRPRLHRTRRGYRGLD
jgi:hypothetical protein